MKAIEKAVHHLNQNQGRGSPRNGLEKHLLSERMRRDRNVARIAAIAVFVVAMIALAVMM